MTTFIATLYRDLACAAAAAVITLVLGTAFVQSTSVPPVQTVAQSVRA
jgi:hypothetical protein